MKKLILIILISLTLIIPVHATDRIPSQIYIQGFQDGFQGELYNPPEGKFRGCYMNGYEEGKIINPVDEVYQDCHDYDDSNCCY